MTQDVIIPEQLTDTSMVVPSNYSTTNTYLIPYLNPDLPNNQPNAQGKDIALKITDNQLFGAVKNHGCEGVLNTNIVYETTLEDGTRAIGLSGLSAFLNCKYISADNITWSGININNDNYLYLRETSDTEQYGIFETVVRSIDVLEENELLMGIRYSGAAFIYETNPIGKEIIDSLSTHIITFANPHGNILTQRDIVASGIAVKELIVNRLHIAKVLNMNRKGAYDIFIMGEESFNYNEVIGTGAYISSGLVTANSDARTDNYLAQDGLMASGLEMLEYSLFLDNMKVDSGISITTLKESESITIDMSTMNEFIDGTTTTKHQHYNVNKTGVVSLSPPYPSAVVSTLTDYSANPVDVKAAPAFYDPYSNRSYYFIPFMDDIKSGLEVFPPVTSTLAVMQCVTKIPAHAKRLKELTVDGLSFMPLHEVSMNVEAFRGEEKTPLTFITQSGNLIFTDIGAEYVIEFDHTPLDLVKEEPLTLRYSISGTQFTDFYLGQTNVIYDTHD